MGNDYILKTQKFIIREDDFDPRYSLDFVKKIHELFLEKNLIHTVALLPSKEDRIGHTEELISYINSTSNWDIQVHGWHHEKYSEWKYEDTVKDLFAVIGYIRQKFNKDPSIFYPPWNCDSDILRKACQYVGLEHNNNCAYIMSYTNTPEKYQDKNVVFFHAWDKYNYPEIPKLLDMAKL